jgi:hypothetical protein
MTICWCYSWEMTLNFGIDASFDNMQAWKEIRHKNLYTNS